MSRDLFGFKDEPFSAYPDNKYFFSSIHHDKAITLLEYGLNSRKGFMLLTGLKGTGKSVTCNILKESVEDCNVAIISTDSQGPDRLIRDICDGFGVGSDGDRDQLFARLMEFFVDQYREGNNNLVIIDNAENITDESLDMLNSFMEIEIEKCKLVQVILCGSPDLHDRLKNIGTQLGPKFTFTVELAPLSLKDTSDYVEHRIVTAMEVEDQTLFKKTSYAAIYNYSKGIPSEINRIAHKALEIAKEKKASKITPGYVRMAAARLYGVKATRKAMLKPSYVLFATIFIFAGVLFYKNIDSVGSVTFKSDVQQEEVVIVKDDTRTSPPAPVVSKPAEVLVEPSDVEPKVEVTSEEPESVAEAVEEVVEPVVENIEPLPAEPEPVVEEVKEKVEEVVKSDTPVVEEDVRYGCITANRGLKMRSLPSVDGVVVLTAPKFAPVKLSKISEDGKWWSSEYDGKEGYMYAKFVRLVDNPEDCKE